MSLVSNFELFTANAQARLRTRWAKFFNDTADHLENCEGRENAVAELRDQAKAAKEDFLHLELMLEKAVRFKGHWYEVRVRLNGPYLGWDFQTSETGEENKIDATLSGALGTSEWEGERVVALLRLEMHDIGTYIRNEFAKLVLFFREFEETGTLRDPKKVAAKEKKEARQRHIALHCETEFRHDAEEFWKEHREALLKADGEVYCYKPTSTAERKAIRALKACDMLKVKERRGAPWAIHLTSTAYAVAKAEGHVTAADTPDTKLLSNFFKGLKENRAAAK